MKTPRGTFRLPGKVGSRELRQSFPLEQYAARRVFFYRESLPKIHGWSVTLTAAAARACGRRTQLYTKTQTALALTMSQVALTLTRALTLTLTLTLTLILTCGRSAS